jgi:hypothetical protein
MRLLTTNYCTEDATVVTASSADPRFPASNLKHPFRSKRCRLTNLTSSNVVFDFITTEEVNSVVMLWPKEDGILLSNTAVIKIQANATNTWTSPAVDVTMTIDNQYEVASHFFSTDQSYRYWRVVVEDPGNANGFLELGMVWIGKSLDIENAQNGFSFDLIDRSKTQTTDFGHTYVDEFPLVASVQLQYKNLDYETIQILENAFRENGTKYPVIIALDPDEDVFDKNHYLVYGKMKPSFGSKHVNYNILDADGISILELS